MSGIRFLRTLIPAPTGGLSASVAEGSATAADTLSAVFAQAAAVVEGSATSTDTPSATQVRAATIAEGNLENYILYSDQFDNAAWLHTFLGTGTTAVVTANAATAPDGTSTADRVQMSCGAGVTAGDISVLSQTVATGLAVNGNYADSIWLKSNTGASQTLWLDDQYGGNLGGTAITVTTSWQQFTGSGATNFGSQRQIRMLVRGDGSNTRSPDLLVWGAQLNNGDSVKPYVATTSAAITDVATATDTPSVTKTLVAAVAEGSATAADTPSSSLVTASAIVEGSATAADSPSSSLVTASAIAEGSASAADTQSGAFVVAATIAEGSASAADSPSSVLAFAASVAEGGATSSDTPTAVLVLSAGVSEGGATAVDTPSALAIFAASVAEGGATASDSPSAVLVLSAGVSEGGATSTDTPSAVLVLSATASEGSATAADTPSALLTKLATIAEGAVTPTFSLPLQSTLVPTVAAGSSTPTFTRATTATFQDWEGVVRTAISGESRFVGARRVRNLVQAPENLNGAGWLIQTGATVTQISGAEWEINLTASADNTGVYFTVTTPGTGNNIRIAFTAWMNSSSGNGVITLSEPNNGAFTAFDLTLTTAQTRYAVNTFTNVINVACGCWFKRKSGGAGALIFRIKFPQTEVVTGQSNQNPSEYVSVGVLAAPYHGAGVDSVKYFTTLNGQTVASNVVVEATGLPITPANGGSASVCDAAGPWGLLAEGARTNLALYSDALANYSVVGSVRTYETATSPDGTLTADTITANAANSAHGVYRSGGPVSATVQTISAFFKAGTSSFCYLAAYGLTANNSYCGVFNLASGVVGETKVGSNSGTVTTSSITAYSNGWYRCSVTGQFTDAGTTYFEFGMAGAATGNTFTAASEPTFNSAGTETLNVWGYQIESAAFASAYIPTTTASVTRNADALTYLTSGNINASVGSAFCEHQQATLSPAFDCKLISGASGGIFLSQANSGSAYISDGPDTAQSTGVPVAGVISKYASTWSSGGLAAFLNGGSKVSATFNGAIPLAGNLVVLGNTGNSTLGTIRNVKIFPSALSDAQVAVLPADLFAADTPSATLVTLASVAEGSATSTDTPSSTLARAASLTEGSATSGDTPSATLTLAAAVAEGSATAADSPSATVVAGQQAVAEGSATSADTEDATLVRAASLAEGSATAAETTSSVVSSIASVAEGSAASSDATDATRAQTGSVAEGSATATDAPSATQAYATALTEGSATASDAPSATQVRAATAAEGSATSTDTPSALLVEAAALAEGSATAADTPDATIASANPVISEGSATAVDTCSASIVRAGSIAEGTASAQDTYIVAGVWAAFIAEGSPTAADTQGAAKALAATATEGAATANDTPSALVIATGSVAEGTASAADVLTVQVLWNAVIAETGAAQDTVSAPTSSQVAIAEGSATAIATVDATNAAAAVPCATDAYTIDPENRVLAVNEDRTLLIPGEDRVWLVPPDDRVFSPLPEDRKL